MKKYKKELRKKLEVYLKNGKYEGFFEALETFIRLDFLEAKDFKEQVTRHLHSLLECDDLASVGDCHLQEIAYTDLLIKSVKLGIFNEKREADYWLEHTNLLSRYHYELIIVAMIEEGFLTEEEVKKVLDKSFSTRIFGAALKKGFFK